jgi:hypothetical protein
MLGDFEANELAAMIEGRERSESFVHILKLPNRDFEFSAIDFEVNDVEDSIGIDLIENPKDLDLLSNEMFRSPCVSRKASMAVSIKVETH